MLGQRTTLWVLPCCLALLVSCGRSDEGKAGAGMVAGRVTMADGAVLRGNVKDIQLSIQGVSEAGERVSFSPVVKPDGSYQQKVPPGQYNFGPARIVVTHDNNEHQFDLEPVGMNWNKNQDAAEGIAQDFVWKLTGATPYGMSNGKDNGNATHWYGRSISLRPEGFRNDINQVPKPIPDQTMLSFEFKATGTLVDGSTQSTPILVERPYSTDFGGTYDVPDLPPASYQLTGSARLPDGSVVPLLFNGEKYASPYVPTKPLPLEVDGLIGGMFKPQVTFIIE